jgi:hypothetical protein
LPEGENHGKHREDEGNSGQSRHHNEKGGKPECPAALKR